MHAVNICFRSASKCDPLQLSLTRVSYLASNRICIQTPRYRVFNDPRCKYANSVRMYGRLRGHGVAAEVDDDDDDGNDNDDDGEFKLTVFDSHAG